MAYAVAPFGFIPRRYLSGAPYNGAANAYWVSSADGTALFLGDPVQISGASNTAKVKVAGGGEYAAGELEGVVRATAGATNKVVGVVVAVLATTRDSNPHRTASTERVVMVADDPQIVFEAQADAAVALASIGLNSNVVFSAAGSTATSRSGAAVGTTASGATNQLTIVGFPRDPKNTPAAAGNRCLVQFTLHQRASAGGIVGV